MNEFTQTQLAATDPLCNLNRPIPFFYLNTRQPRTVGSFSDLVFLFAKNYLVCVFECKCAHYIYTQAKGQLSRVGSLNIG